MIRVTTNGVLTGYKSGLTRSRNKVNDARDKVLTQRNFNSFAEDPAAATKAFQMRRSLWDLSSQIGNSQSVTGKFNTAFQGLMSANEGLGRVSKEITLTALNEATGTGTKALGKTITELGDSLVQTLNSQYGASFIFAGADGGNAPFAWENGKLTFRGIDVNSPPNSPEYAKLQAMAGETTFADLGLGFREDASGEMISSTAFNSALSGLNVLGYGTDEDNDPKNLVLLMKELGSIFSRCNADADTSGDSPNGIWSSTQDKEDAFRLAQKLESALTTFSTAYEDISIKTTFLKTNEERLEDTFDNLNENLLEVEQIDMADAINSFSWAQYCYNAALKVGNSIMSESLIDYMR